MKTAYDITDAFEKKVAEYTGAPYAVAVDNQSNALFLALTWLKQSIGITEDVISIPKHTYPSVPCEIIHAGYLVEFLDWHDQVIGNTLHGPYRLYPTMIWDSALRFTADMFVKNNIYCLSFTGPHKHLKLGKGGMILTDNEDAYRWFKRARFSGRNECSYHEDNFDMLGWNFYMLPEIAAKGLRDMNQFYNADGSKKHNEDLSLPYPDLSKFPIYQQ